MICTTKCQKRKYQKLDMRIPDCLVAWSRYERFCFIQQLLLRHTVRPYIVFIIVPPTLRQLVGNIVLVMHASHLFMPSVTFKPWMLGSWNVILYRFLMEKHSWPIFRSSPENSWFQSYAPFKSNRNIVRKISKNVLELGPWYRVFWQGMKCKLPD